MDYLSITFIFMSGVLAGMFVTYMVFKPMLYQTALLMMIFRGTLAGQVKIVNEEGKEWNA